MLRKREKKDRAEKGLEKEEKKKGKQEDEEAK
jgi:hypothetical protein